LNSVAATAPGQRLKPLFTPVGSILKFGRRSSCGQRWSQTLVQHSLEVARPPVRQKRNRRGRSKYALSEAPDWNSDKPGLDAEVDESHFAHITADIVARARDKQPSMPTSPLAVSSGPEPRKSKLLSSSAGLLVYKGEAKASVIEAPPTETSLQPHVVDEEDNQADKALDRLRAESGARGAERRT
jgi:hypothetical protein